MEKGREGFPAFDSKHRHNSKRTTSAVRDAGLARRRHRRAGRRHRRIGFHRRRIRRSGALPVAVLHSPSESVRSAPPRSAQPWLYPHRHYLTSLRMRIHETVRIRGLSQSELDPPVRTRRMRHQDPARSSGTKCSRHRYSSTVYSFSVFLLPRHKVTADRLGPIRANLGRIME